MSDVFDDVYGDVELGARLRAGLGRRHRVAAAATVSAEGLTVAGFGARLEADYEIGSVSKGITGLLYADALERGDVLPTSTLGGLLPLGHCEAAAVTLASLSTHSSGLPVLPRSAEPVRRTLALWRDGTNPYGETLEELLIQAAGVRLSAPRPRYSNLGFELLGHAVARAAGVTYSDLLRQRLTAPLDLGSVYAPESPDRLRANSLVGRSRSGRFREPWTGEAVAPAGGIRAAVGDLARLLAAMLDGSAPGMAALDPVARFGRGIRIGAAWFTVDVKGRSITWHNGGTGGFRTWAGLDRSAGTGVAVMSAVSAPVDRFGFALLQKLSGAYR